MTTRIINIRNPGSSDGVLVRLDGLEIDFLREDDEERLALVSRPVWDDLRFHLSRDKQGQTSKPDYDFTLMALMFPQNDPTEIAYLQRQLSHAILVGGPLHPHIHYIQDEAQDPVWKMDYRIYKNNTDPTGSFTTLTSDEVVFPYTSGTILQIATFPEIDASAIDRISAFVDIRLYRDDDVVSGDVAAKGFDLHHQRDSLGSIEEYTK